MKSQCSHTLTLAVPEPMIEPANHLACLMGESSADIDVYMAHKAGLTL